MRRLLSMPRAVVLAAVTFAAGAGAFAPVPHPVAESEALTAAMLVRGGATGTIAWGHDAEPKLTSVFDGPLGTGTL